VAKLMRGRAAYLLHIFSDCRLWPCRV